LEDVAGGLRAAGVPSVPNGQSVVDKAIGALRSSCSRRTRTRKIAGCITLVHTGNADVLAFVKDRIAGKPATASC